MGNFRRLYRWAQKKTGLRKASAVLAAEKAFHDRRALGASFASANDDKEYDLDGNIERNSTLGHASLLVSAVESKHVERPRAPSVVSSSVLTLPRPLNNSPAAPPKWMKHPRSGRNRILSHDSVSSLSPHRFCSFSNQRTFSNDHPWEGENNFFSVNRQRSKPRKKASQPGLGITYETRVALNVLVGFPLSSQAQAKLQEASMPMDIELKELKTPAFIERSCLYGSSFFPARNPHLYRAGTSILPTGIQEEFGIGSNSERMSECSAQILNNLVSPFYSLTVFMHRFFGGTISMIRRYLSGPADDVFYEAVRTQPFSSGAYLRGFLISGFSNTFFHVYSLTFWKYTYYHHPDLTPNQNTAKTFLLIWLCAQISLALLQFPLRLNLHINFFQSSRSIDLDTAISILRRTVQGDVWYVCRTLGWLNDLIAVMGLVCIEIYLRNVDDVDNYGKKDPLRSFMIALASTNVMSFIIKIFVGLVFGISMHDPQVLLEARKRGLSRLDLDILPTFVFTSKSDVMGVGDSSVDDCECDCSICMTSFDMGDMLIALPCDKRHHFHASCIREWLQRQNSCPLCQAIM